MQELILVENLTKNFANFVAVDGVNLSVAKGDVLGFLGPNGAGKTTTMRMITGYLSPTSGNIKVCGFSAPEQILEIKKNIGYLPEGGPLYNDMTPESFLQFVGNVRGLYGPALQERFDFVVEKLHLKAVLRQTIDTLSKGFKRRVALAQAIIHDPEVLILDEPTDGLDPNQKFEVRELIKSMAKDKAIIISTHILEEVEAICNKVVLIANGKIVASGTVDDIIAKTDSGQRAGSAVYIKLKKDSIDKALNEILAIKNVAKVKMEGKNAAIAFSKDGKDILGDISNTMYRLNYQIEELYLRRGSLEQAFRELTA